jgi:hypothetical protein
VAHRDSLCGAATCPKLGADRKSTVNVFFHLKAFPFGKLPERGQRVIYDLASDSRSGRTAGSECVPTRPYMAVEPVNALIWCKVRLGSGMTGR